MTTEILAGIQFKHRSGASAYCGIVLYDDVVVEAAPLIGFMKGWTRARVKQYCADRDWATEIIWATERRDIDAKGRATRELHERDGEGIS